jgi:DNA-3-methyladenine glycosylase I
MTEEGKAKEFVEALRETLLSQATSKSERERQKDPNIAVLRRARVRRHLAKMDGLRFNPNLSDEDFWKIAAMKPFHAGKRASAVDERVPHMLKKYLGDREALDSKEWNEGGKKFEKFLKDSENYRHKPALKKVIRAARRINEWKRVNNRSIIDFYTYRRGDISTPEALRQIHEHLQGDLRFGAVTIFHLMTELGFEVVKPDRVLNRSTVRMGWINGYEKNGARYPLDPDITTKRATSLGSDADFLWALQGVYRDISEASGVSMRSLDYIVVKLGQEPDERGGFARTVCHARKPLCQLCSVKPMCAYGRKQ